MSLIPRQPDADDEVIAYWLKKRFWSDEEFASLYCGVNPFILKYEADWADRKALGALATAENDYVLQISAEKKQNILEIQVLINDRLVPTFSQLKSPSFWRSTLGALELKERTWMQQIQEPKKENPAKPSIPIEKPLDARAQNTLLIIIQALCESLAIKTNAHGAATQIANLTQKIGAPVDADTVGKWLKQIPKAMESRGK